ncbi:hypothetical protein, partial [Salmonella enterica]|uniref:hypothetical protein n=1 Tax=Salmonella enterica TaxID=28901 RepID=UPI003CE7F92D
LTGDLSYDADRRPTAAVRLRDLAGVERLAAHYPNVERHAGRDVRAEFTLAGLGPHVLRPCLRMRPLEAEVLGKAA